MSAFAKSKLKAAKDAIGKKDYEKARDASLGVLEYEPENYTANVFLGIALLKLGNTDESEQVYRKAIDSNPGQLLAWQGLSQLYEQTQKWEAYADTLRKLADMHASTNDAAKCAEAVQKLIDLRRVDGPGTRLQLAEALVLLLPDSPLYPVLSGLPPPDPTSPTTAIASVAQSAMQNSLPVLEEIVSLYEQEEEAFIKNEVEKRRTRLGAPGIDKIRKDVTLEVYGASKLPKLYDEVMSHPNASDELRRSTESKLLLFKQRYLYAIPDSPGDSARKTKISAELDELVNGMVLINVENELAWTLFIESKDAAYLEDYDSNVLRKFVGFFPGAPTTKLIESYFHYMGIPLSTDEDEPPAPPNPDVDYFEATLDALSDSPDSILAHRVVASLYEQEADYENAIKVAESGLELVRRSEQNHGKIMPNSRKAFKVVLATSLVHFFPPKHHIRALGIIDDVLAEDAENIPCLMGRGFVLQSAKKWTEARDVFAKVTRLAPEDLAYGIRAKEEEAWCQAMEGDLQSSAEALKSLVTELDHFDGREEDKARCWWRLGRCFWEMGGDNRDDAYKHFVTALKRLPTFAPAFTSLGVYYAEHLSPPDPNRASKCFQKAFELDPREADAARRLADGFAEEGEWDLVEVIARRTIEGEGLESGADAKALRRYLPLNAWAWKAVGIVELNRRNYDPAIDALQIALRTDVDDRLSWLRLGEAYSKAGRYAAAFKALDRVRELDPDDWIAAYFIGEVQRQMGTFEEAIEAFKSILEQHPAELGVLHSLSLTYLDLGRVESASGFIARSEGSFLAAIETSLHLVESSSGFRRVAWKTVSDALFLLSDFYEFSEQETLESLLSRIISMVSDTPREGLADVVPHPVSLDHPSGLSTVTLQVAIASYNYRLSLNYLDDAAGASAHHDLGIALSAFARRTVDASGREAAEKEAIVQLKTALKLDPGCDTYWIALGNATFLSQPGVCQHAYIRALEIDKKSAASWTSLGLFYLHHNDVELANEAFYKAQVLDPDYALAWVGQALVATANGHHPESRALLEHATSLTAAVPEADLEFATRLFAHETETAHARPPAPDALLPAFFVLDRYTRRRPADASAQHLLGLVCERLGHTAPALAAVTRAIAIIEAAYEETEDPALERRFATAHANAARLRLTLGDPAGALEGYATALGLLPEDGEQSLRAQCELGSARAQLAAGAPGEAIALFAEAAAAAEGDPVLRGHACVLHAQALWALGSDDARESAKAQLLQSIEIDPENLTAIGALAGMGILTGDDGLVDAALSELVALPLDERLARDPGRDVPHLLVQHHLAQGEPAHARAVLQKAVFAEPERAEGRRELALMALRSGDGAAARAVLGDAGGGLPELRASLGLHAVALCLESGDRARAAETHQLAQKAVMLSPWDERAWEVLAYVRSRSAP